MTLIERPTRPMPTRPETTQAIITKKKLSTSAAPQKRTLIRPITAAKARPQTAPSLSEIPEHKKQHYTKEKLLKEWDYISVPDSGTDSDGEHFIFGFRKAKHPKVSRGLKKHLYVVVNMKEKSYRTVKGKDIESQRYV